MAKRIGAKFHLKIKQDVETRLFEILTKAKGGT